MKYNLNFSRYLQFSCVYNKFPPYSWKAGKLDILWNHPIQDGNCLQTYKLNTFRRSNIEQTRGIWHLKVYDRWLLAIWRHIVNKIKRLQQWVFEFIVEVTVYICRTNCCNYYKTLWRFGGGGRGRTMTLPDETLLRIKTTSKVTFRVTFNTDLWSRWFVPT
jgi:hypothetical protein